MTYFFVFLILLAVIIFIVYTGKTSIDRSVKDVFEEDRLNKISRWHRVYTCVECSHELSNSEMMYSYGTCPYCGHMSNWTICEAKSVARRWNREKEDWEYR